MHRPSAGSFAPPTLLAAVAGPGTPRPTLCPAACTAGAQQGTWLPAWAHATCSAGPCSHGAPPAPPALTAAALLAAAGGALQGMWPAQAGGTAAPLGLLQALLQQRQATCMHGGAAAAPRVHLAALRSCGGGEQWQVWGAVSPSAACSRRHMHQVLGTAGVNATAAAAGGTCDGWQLAVAVLPGGWGGAPLLVGTGGQLAVPLASAWLLPLQVPAGLSFRVLSVAPLHEAGEGGGAAPCRGGACPAPECQFVGGGTCECAAAAGGGGAALSCAGWRRGRQWGCAVCGAGGCWLLDCACGGGWACRGGGCSSCGGVWGGQAAHWCVCGRMRGPPCSCSNGTAACAVAASGMPPLPGPCRRLQGPGWGQACRRGPQCALATFYHPTPLSKQQMASTC